MGMEWNRRLDLTNGVGDTLGITMGIPYRF